MAGGGAQQHLEPSMLAFGKAVHSFSLPLVSPSLVCLLSFTVRVGPCSGRSAAGHNHWVHSIFAHLVSVGGAHIAAITLLSSSPTQLNALHALDSLVAVLEGEWLSM